MTKARDTGEVLNTRGTAATADVQTSPTDATAGALMAVGAFGLGTDSIGYIGAGQDADTYDVSGVYYAGFSNGYTTGSAFLTVEASAGTRVKQIWRQANGTAIAERYKDATWSEWKRTDPQAFGLGGYVISADTDYDAGDYLVGGNYITPSSAMSNAPSDYTSGRHVIAVDGTAIYIAQTLYGVTGSDKGKIWSRAFNGVTWSDWKRTDPQAFGLGLDDPLNEAPITDLHDLSVTTLTAYSSPDANTPTNLNGVVRFEARNGGTSSIRGYLYAVDSDGMHYSKTNVGGTWEAWQPVYTGANLNPNVFGGGGFVATGWASSDTVARFLLPTHGISDATSITLGGGTFDVLAGASAVTGGVNTTAITLGSSGANTPMGTIIQVSGLSGMVSGDYLQLFGDTSNSQITVNF